MRTLHDDRCSEPGSSRIDVLVVGGGPVGLLAAGLLARLGVSVVVVERSAGEESFPKGRTLLPRSMEILRQFGLEPRVRAIALDPSLYRNLFVGRTLLEPTKVTAAPVHNYAYSPCRKVICSKGGFETVLAEFATAEGAEVLFSSRATEITIGQNSVMTRVVCEPSGRVRSFESAYVVGADGANSGVRAAARIDGRSAVELPRSVSIHFRARLADRMRGRTSLLYRLESGGTVVAVDNQDRWLLMLERGEGTFDGTEATAAVRAAIGDPTVHCEVLGIRFWTPAIWLTDTMWSGRIVLAGDAAHTALPVSGLGMNLGVQDAYALAWRLAFLVRGIGTQDLLGSYDRERRTVAASNLRLSMAQAKTGSRRPVPEVTCLYRYDLGDGLGGRVPHRWLDRTGSRSILDLIGYRFTVLIRAPAAEPTELVNAFESLGVAVDVVTEPLLEPSGWDAALLRPDGHIAWTGTADLTPTAAADLASASLGRPLNVTSEVVQGLS